MRRTGRPPGITAIQDPLAVAKAVARIRAEGLYATQEEVADRLGVDVRTLQRYLAARDIPWPLTDLQDPDLMSPSRRGQEAPRARRWAA